MKRILFAGLIAFLPIVARADLHPPTGLTANGTISSGTITTFNATTVNATTATITNLVGTTGATNAFVGNIGEYISATQDFTNVAAASGNYGDVVSITLTPGDWDITGIGSFSLNSATISGNVGIGISTSTGNNGALLTNGDNFQYAALPTTSPASATVIVRASIAAQTIYYLKERISSYSVATPQIAAKISARRIR